MHCPDVAGRAEAGVSSPFPAFHIQIVIESESFMWKSEKLERNFDLSADTRGYFIQV
jgi:hypothetical protein